MKVFSKPESLLAECPWSVGQCIYSQERIQGTPNIEDSKQDSTQMCSECRHHIRQCLRPWSWSTARRPIIQRHQQGRLPRPQSMTVLKVLAVSRVMVAWQPVGIAWGMWLLSSFQFMAFCVGVYDMCVRYTKQRRQFGASIASFQLVQERLSRMQANIQVHPFFKFMIWNPLLSGLWLCLMLTGLLWVFTVCWWREWMLKMPNGCSFI